MKKTPKPAAESSKAVAQLNSSKPLQEVKLSEAQSIECFLELVGNGIADFRAAGELLAQMYEQDKSIFVKIMREAEWLTVDILWSFLRIGLKQLQPEAMLYAGTRAFPKLLAMSYDEQAKAIGNPRLMHELKTAPEKRSVVNRAPSEPKPEPERTPEAPRRPLSMMELVHQKSHGIYQIVIKPGKPMQIFKGFGESADMQKVRMMKDPDNESDLVANIQLYEVI